MDYKFTLYLGLNDKDTKSQKIATVATEREQQEYRLQLRAVRAEFGKRVDKYLKRFGTSKLHIWSYWADR